MSFENLSYRCAITISDYPTEWLPFLHLYDADLPLFPLQYFHVLPNDFRPEKIPRAEDRAFGYMERAHLTDSGLEVSIICNKDLANPNNSPFISPVTSEIRERLGVSNPVVLGDISAAFQAPLTQANAVLVEIWRRIVSGVLGDCLPFGRFFDAIFGLARLVASFYSPGGRKSEWIQTHYFYSRFGERVQVTGNLPKMDFYLLPTFTEVTDQNNSLRLFPRFRALSEAAKDFHRTFCSVNSIGEGLTFSKFNAQFSGSLNTAKIMSCINSLSPNSLDPLIQCFNAFDKGPLRTVMFLQMLNDIRDSRLRPNQLTSSQFGLVYDNLRGFYQTPKVIALYAQQCFGNISALPIDTWIETFMKWPLAIYPASGRLKSVFTSANNLGKVERLLWISAQARKVHSSLCDDALWCAKYDSSGKPRGANPLACNACLSSIRNACPAYAGIASKIISFNGPRGFNIHFVIWTSQKNNTIPNQRFILCEGEAHDDFTPVDVPDAFAPFPQPSHQGQALTVDRFVKMYCSSKKHE
jgi:hypothetical protein